MHRLGALQVGDHAASDANNVSRCCPKVVVPRSCRGPHLVVLQQVRVHEYTQLRRVTEGRHATSGFGNLFPQTEPGLAIQVGFDKLPVFGVSDGDLARDRQVVSGLLRISQGGK